MSQIQSPMRFGAPTNDSLKSDLATERSVLSRACANVETSIRTMVRLSTERGDDQPRLGYHGARVAPEKIDHEALVAVRDEALRDARHRLGALQGLLADLLGAR